MHKLLSCLRDSISGWLDGFDRLAFVGHLMPLMMPGAADEFFDGRKILRRDATAWMQTQTKCLEETVASQVEAATGFRVTYLHSTKDSKEEAARMRQQELGISDGLIGAWSCVEPCRSIRMVGGVGAPTLIPIQTQCKHLYVYQIHPIAYRLPSHLFGQHFMQGPGAAQQHVALVGRQDRQIWEVALYEFITWSWRTQKEPAFAAGFDHR